MTASLPAPPAPGRSLTGVLPDMLSALGGTSARLAPARSAIAVVVDGLGRANLTARSGHARFLTQRMGKRDTVRTVFPSTTAAALTSLLTGEEPGAHGLVGYRVRVPGTDATPNLLRGWETDGLDPLTFPRAEPLFARESAHGRPCFVVTKRLYEGTGFTAATQRGAAFVGEDDLVARLAAAADVAARHDGALVYAYVPELDAIGHARGWQSDEWLAALELVDDAARAMDAALPADVGVLVTADHGMVDVPRHRQILLGDSDPLLEGVRLIAGEPRMLHLYADPGAEAAVAARWREAESSRAWVLTRAEAIGAGLFGDRVDAEVLPRIGDVLVAARADVVYYDDRLADKKPQRMIGQHGSLTDQEQIVPLIRLGAFAR
ncbi:alkaline phosphatase family protein [Microbacterium sp. No. 7]|uniref:alkaline phosphatase family protein n=1 Tax=Microbacterium sp. No. 7 TaxID=1714373 RepID=UPI0006D0CB07|nr:alkaline phosphatase family protein [Microbacterium sp. No. 7]ALJ20440.1 nucleotide pyrophosphatase [Microbacterium sp. No. 7]